MNTQRTFGPILIGLFAAAFPLLGQAKSSQPNVLLLSVDTLRADALHSYGYTHAITPTLDKLAQDGVLFEDVLATIGKTGPSFASVFTSLSPPSHGARRNGIAMRDDVPTLAESFLTHGYTTAAFISNWTLKSRLARVDRGFETYDEEFNAKRNFFGARERTADAVIEAVASYLEGRSQPDQSKSKRQDQKPLFLWVHFSEPHTPFDLHDSVTVPKPPTSDRPSGWRDRWRYANEVAYTDNRVAALFETLGPHMDLSETIIVFVGDHGESLGEHGYTGHGKNTLWPNLRIPLIIKGPGVPRGQRIKGPAINIDIFPTLLEMLAFDPPETSTPFEGVSLVSAFTRDLPADRLRFTVGDRHTAFGTSARQNYEDPKEISLESQTLKVTFDFSSNKTVYYDLSSDPHQNNPLKAPPEVTKPPWRRKLANWYRALPKFDKNSGAISEEDRRQLESLGYVGAP